MTTHRSGKAKPYKLDCEARVNIPWVKVTPKEYKSKSKGPEDLAKAATNNTFGVIGSALTKNHE
jgi:hypothetical protein